MNENTNNGVHWSFWVIGAIVAQVPYIEMADLPREAWFGWLSQVVIGGGLVWYSMRAKGKAVLGEQ